VFQWTTGTTTRTGNRWVQFSPKSALITELLPGSIASVALANALIQNYSKITAKSKYKKNCICHISVCLFWSFLGFENLLLCSKISKDQMLHFCTKATSLHEITHTYTDRPFQKFSRCNTWTLALFTYKEREEKIQNGPKRQKPQLQERGEHWTLECQYWLVHITSSS